MKYVSISLFSGLILLTADFASAISKDKHQLVTRHAIDVYSQCISYLGVENHLDEKAELISIGSKIEDESPLLQRYFNWHFYDSYRNNELYRMGRSLTGARTSLHHIYRLRTAYLTDKISTNKDEFYQGIGRVVHYIQDMTVPAHVAPIYHYKFLFMDQSDFFDSIALWQTSKYIWTPSTCDFDSDEANHLQSGLDRLMLNTAKMTITHIKGEISVPKGHRFYGKTWQQFWTLREPGKSYPGAKKGFSEYGPEGREGFKKFCESEPELVKEFFGKSFNAAVKGTVQALLLINAAREKAIK